MVPAKQRLRPACAYPQSDQSLCLSLEHSLTVKLLTEHHLAFLSLKGGCTGSSESTCVKMPHCWKSHVMAHLYLLDISESPDSGYHRHTPFYDENYGPNSRPDPHSAVHSTGRSYHLSDITFSASQNGQDSKVRSQFYDENYVPNSRSDPHWAVRSTGRSYQLLDITFSASQNGQDSKVGSQFYDENYGPNSRPDALSAVYSTGRSYHLSDITFSASQNGQDSKVRSLSFMMRTTDLTPDQTPIRLSTGQEDPIVSQISHLVLHRMAKIQR